MPALPTYLDCFYGRASANDPPPGPWYETTTACIVTAVTRLEASS
jgi:hypothetical protein